MFVRWWDVLCAYNMLRLGHIIGNQKYQAYGGEIF